MADAGSIPPSIITIVLESQFMGTCFQFILYGINVSLVFFFVYLFRKSTQRNTRTFTTLAALILLMFFFWTLETITSWYAIWYIFIKYGDTAVDEFVHLGSSMSESTTAFVNVMNLWTTFRMAIGDSIIVWRCWVICGCSWRMVAFPFILNILSFVSGIVSFVGMMTLQGPNAPDVMNRLVAINICFSAATTVFATLIIVVHITRNRMSRHMPRSQGPQTAMEMIVESSALYSISAIIYIPFRMLYSEEVGSRAFNLAFVFASGFFYSMVSIAPTLIMLRVAMQRARPKADANWKHFSMKLQSFLRESTQPTAVHPIPNLHLSTSDLKAPVQDRPASFIILPDTNSENFEDELWDVISHRLRGNGYVHGAGAGGLELGFEEDMTRTLTDVEVGSYTMDSSTRWSGAESKDGDFA